ncbi:MAG TPA: N-6 DNA methylase, partial [Cyclobacteriaceae bacterium]|nr:N-6 DNA methylase [Cyclobacteriaceae bacterium]
RREKAKARRKKVLFIDGSDQIRIGRAQNFLEKEHVERIFKWYSVFKDVENSVKVATMDMIKENDYNLNIPLYVEKVIEDNLPSVEVALTELKEAWNKSLEAEEKFKKILKSY